MPGPNEAQPMTVGEVGEFPLIARLTARLPAARPDVLVGIGDDVAVMTLGSDRLLLATCDVQVAGVHFLLERSDPVKLGRKMAAINLSDIAACGGWPTHFLVSLGLPADTNVSFLDAVYDGLAAEASRFGADVVGGNISRSAQLFFDLSLLGEAKPECLLRRSGARPGDAILVTGRLGASAAGLSLLTHPEARVPPEARTSVLAAHETPTPRLNEVKALTQIGGITAMIDVSDGLTADLGHLCDAGKVGAELRADALPIDEPTRAAAKATGTDPLAWALGGGEDYELLFTASPAKVETLSRAVRDATGTTVSVIGEILPQSEGRRLVLSDGRRAPLGARGWVHF